MQGDLKDSTEVVLDEATNSMHTRVAVNSASAGRQHRLIRGKVPLHVRQEMPSIVTALVSHSKLHLLAPSPRLRVDNDCTAYIIPPTYCQPGSYTTLSRVT